MVIECIFLKEFGLSESLRSTSIFCFADDSGLIV